ncbi:MULTISPECIES: ArsC/Spx/MgsR family protein [Bradyrhizobium]|uniref:ArsC/Spx/MgsR family protein n=1 Tax=Bradyrhizobium TaxID=374 RepID=UPI000D33A39B|nr:MULTISPECIES: ArsC/Spx/MgsR family protein [Bradyrhizobium]MDE5458745.1 arsenate reductase family protein [Bradyrhizobium sp. CSA112]WOH52351.1 ArsC/Spx/MgsR family protein [Bradyrhizobium sp. sBnM-33]
MTTIIFYHKPGCATNARQMQALKAAGHHVIAKDILKEPWRAEELRRFFGNTPVASWFNRAARRIKSGEINPETSDAASALALMLSDPLLIRRPLINADGARCAGFDHGPVLSLVGRSMQDDVERCSREETGGHCSSG